MHSWHEFWMFIADWYVCILKSFLNRGSLSPEEVHWDVDWWTASPPLAGWGRTTRRSICRERRASFIPSVRKYLWNYAVNVYITRTYCISLIVPVCPRERMVRRREKVSCTEQFSSHWKLYRRFREREYDEWFFALHILENLNRIFYMTCVVIFCWYGMIWLIL